MTLKPKVKNALVWSIQQSPTIFSLFILLVLAYLIYSLSYAIFAGLPKILNSTIPELPITNNTYPILLQGLIIVASMVFGFYGILLFYTSKRLNKMVDKYLGGEFMLKLVSFLFILLPLFFLMLSIFFSLNGLTYYGITITFTTEQISTGHIPIAISNSSIENSTYFNLAKNYSATAQGYYKKLLSNTQSSIRMIFLSAAIITAILIIYLIDVFGGFEYVYNKRRQLKHHYVFDISALFFMLGIIFYFKAYILGVALILLIIIALGIIYFLNKKSKPK
jgi:hypothetical protein